MYDLYPQNWNDEGSSLATDRVEGRHPEPRRRARVVSEDTLRNGVTSPRTDSAPAGPVATATNPQS